MIHTKVVITEGGGTEVCLLYCGQIACYAISLIQVDTDCYTGEDVIINLSHYCLR